MLQYIIILTLFATSYSFYTIVPTGYRGVVVSYGVIQDYLLEPGFHTNIHPFVYIEHVQVSPQVDEIKNVFCDTNEKVRVIFDRIEVGNTLSPDYVINTTSKYGFYYDKYWVINKVTHELNVICSNMTVQEVAVDKFSVLDNLLSNFLQNENDKAQTGVKIDFIRLTKPTLPQEITNNYEKMVVERTAKKALEETEKRIHIENKIARDKAENENNMNLDKMKAENNARILQAEAENKIMISNIEAKKNESVIVNEIKIMGAKADNEKAEMEYGIQLKMYSIEGYTEVQKVSNLLPKNLQYLAADSVPMLLESLKRK